MKRWLICLFSYNRVGLLRNAVTSIDRFFPHGDRIIIDDGSNQPGMAEYLAEIAKKPNWKVEVRDRVPGRDYGGYYQNMRFGLELSVAQGYDYCFFFEDDEQLVWNKTDYLDYVDNLFAVCPDAIQIQPLLLRRIINYADTIEYIRPAHAYRTNRGFSTTAIWNLAAVRKHPDFRFFCANGNDLPLNSAYWLRAGYRLYFQGDPTVAVMPWVDSRSVWNGFDKSGAPVAEDSLVLQPLSSGEVDYLRKRDPSVPPFQEYFRLSPENVERPLWHQKGQNLTRYRFLCRNVIERERAAGHSPVPIRILDQWKPSEIPPLQSHLTWERTPESIAKEKNSRRDWPAWLNGPRRIFRMIKEFSPRDLMGYRSLTQQLYEEQRSLPFWKNPEEK